jgi:hypothetical protein
MFDIRARRNYLPIAVTAAVAVLGSTIAALSGGTASADVDPAIARHSKAVVAAKAAAAGQVGRASARALGTDERNFGDFTLDDKADLAAVDSAGTLWIYPGRAIRYSGTGPRENRYFIERVQKGTGFGTFTSLIRHGDWNSDGNQDILARDREGKLILFAQVQGPLGSALAKGRQVGTGWLSFTSILGGGDLTGDGKDDLLGQKSDGTLLLFAGTGDGLKPFGARGVQIGTGWRGDLLTSVGDWSGDGRTEFLFRNTRKEVSLYTSQPGQMPIGARTLLFDAVEGTQIAQIAGTGNLVSDAVIGGQPVTQTLPDPVIKWTNGRLTALALDTSIDFDGAIGSGFGSYRIF